MSKAVFERNSAYPSQSAFYPLSRCQPITTKTNDVRSRTQEKSVHSPDPGKHRTSTTYTPSTTMPDSASDSVQPPLPEEEDLVGLTEVDPSPVDETPAEFKGDYFPESKGSPTSSTLGLGGRGLGYHRMSCQRIARFPC